MKTIEESIALLVDVADGCEPMRIRKLNDTYVVEVVRRSPYHCTDNISGEGASLRDALQAAIMSLSRSLAADQRELEESAKVRQATLEGIALLRSKLEQP